MKNNTKVFLLHRTGATCELAYIQVTKVKDKKMAISEKLTSYPEGIVCFLKDKKKKKYGLRCRPISTAQ